MKLVKSLLLGSAAGIAAVAGAQAADLPSRKAAPVEYVRVCSAYGAGFFFIPGTDTCLRVGGRVRAEYTVGERYGDQFDSFGTRARGRINVDARTATAYGPLRTFIRFELTNSSNFYNSAIGFNQGIVAPGLVRQSSPFATATSLGTFSLLDLAFVQFGPITAGRAQSFFDFYANDYGFSVLRTADARLNLLAYTATFGSGFSATISLEDRVTGTNFREQGSFDRFSGAAYQTQGQNFPDVVASLRVDQGWGSAQLSGAITERGVDRNALTTAAVVSPATGAITVTNVPGAVGTIGGEEYGFAIQGGVKINLPFLAAGDVFWLQAAYADGALGYLGFGSTGVGRLGLIAAGDIGLNPATGAVKTSTGFSIVAALRHFWTPQLRSELIGSYAELQLGHNAAPGVYAVAAPAALSRPLDPKELTVAGSLIWSPVSGLDIGVEVIYQRVELAQRVLRVNNSGARVAGVGIKSEDTFAGRFRIQRDF